MTGADDVARIRAAVRAARPSWIHRAWQPVDWLSPGWRDVLIGSEAMLEDALGSGDAEVLRAALVDHAGLMLAWANACEWAEP